MDLATFCIRQLAELGANDRHIMSASQQALVHCFLKNYDRVIYAVSTQFLKRLHNVNVSRYEYS